MEDTKVLETQESAEPQEQKQDGGQMEPIPEELGGLDEDIAREAMAEMAAMQKEPQGEQEGGIEPTEQEPTGQEPPGTPPPPVPYARFKQKNDEAKALKAELEQMKAQLAARQQQGQPTAQPQPQPPIQQRPSAPPPPQFQLTPENVRLINQAVQQEALRLSGMTQEDVDSLAYLDDGDEKKSRWAMAQQVARGNILDGIRQAQAQQMQRQRLQDEIQRNATMDFNNYAREQMTQSHYRDVVQYAVTEYFNNEIPPAERPVVAMAYFRVENQMATPQDIVLVKNHFRQALASYQAKKANGQRQQGASVTQRVQAANSFPRSMQVEGTGDNGNVSVATIEKMLDEMPLESIPENIRKKLESGTYHLR